MKIIVLIPIWKRPELTRKCIEALCKLKPKGIELNVFCVLSYSDPAFLKQFNTVNDFKIFHTITGNKPLGLKKAFGLAEVMRFYPDYDYIMELGSDDFINPKLFELYFSYIRAEIPFFGLNNLYMYHIRTDKLIWVKEYAGEDMTFGCGRMIHRLVIEKIGCNFSTRFSTISDGIQKNIFT